MGRFKWAVQPSVMETYDQQVFQRANNVDQTDSDGNIEGNDKFKERELKKSSHLSQLWSIMSMDQTYILVKLLI